MKVLAFAASSSTESINKALATAVAALVPDAQVTVLDLNDFELPLYSADRERELGHPDKAQAFLDAIADADALVISFASHNGTYTAAYKNIFDWASRINAKVYEGKPALLLSTSPGPTGAENVLQQAVASMPFFGGSVADSVAFPSFHANFNPAQGQISDAALLARLSDAANKLAASVN